MKKLLYKIFDRFTFNQLPYLNFFIDMEKKSIGELKNFQFEKIKETASKFNICINTWDDFYNLPITTKSDLPDTPNFLDEKMWQHETSGSTGQPRVIWVPPSTWYRKDAIFTRSWLKMGRTDQLVFRLISGEPKYPFYDSLRNVKAMNYKTLSQEHVNWVVKNKPFLIHGPGGSIRQLCEMIIDSGHADVLKDIKIHWCSESSYGHKERLEPLVKEFHEQYGLAELATVGATDGFKNIRVVMEQGIIEILDDNGNQTPEGEEGYIVVTDFNNYQTPILRYRCGDRGKMKKIENNGRQYYVLYDIIGRGVDYYNGPEVKRAIGWWIVSPISHTIGHVIEKWRCEVNIPRKVLILHLKFREKEDYDSLKPYSEWVKENVGLDTEFVIADDEHYDIYWKNKLVRVIK
jgi:phenylacetate-coenzyme A ligase PaaK-like adenylate-forming protein